MEYAIVFLPLIGSIISGFFGKKIGDRYCPTLVSVLVLISGYFFLLSEQKSKCKCNKDI